MKAKGRRNSRLSSGKGGSCSLHPNKTRFKDHDSAVRALHHIANKSDRDNVPLRAYQCVCGGYHLTHEEQR